LVLPPLLAGNARFHSTSYASAAGNTIAEAASTLYSRTYLIDTLSQPKHNVALLDEITSLELRQAEIRSQGDIAEG
jgi:hypothetical protein